MERVNETEKERIENVPIEIESLNERDIQQKGKAFLAMLLLLVVVPCQSTPQSALT